MGKFADELINKFPDVFPGKRMLADFKERSLAWLIQRYIEEMEQPGMRPIGRTAIGRLQLLQKWAIGQVEAAKLTKADLIAHCRWRRQSVKPATTMHDLSCIAVVLKYAGAAWPDCDGISDTAIRTAKPFLVKLQLVGKSTPRKRVASDEEKAKLWAYFEERDRKPGVEIKMIPIMAFASISTRRRGEICRIRIPDIDFTRKVYLVRDVKNPNGSKGNHKEFPIFPELEELMRAQIATLDPASKDDRLYPYQGNSVGALFCEAKNELGIKNLRFHDFRRLATTHWLKILPPHKVRQITGHETTVILERVYAAPKAEELVAEVAAQRQQMAA